MEGAVSAREESQQAARVIFIEADRMHRLVLDLLDLARFDSGTVSLESSPVNVAQLANNTISRPISCRKFLSDFTRSTNHDEEEAGEGWG